MSSDPPSILVERASYLLFGSCSSITAMIHLSLPIQTYGRLSAPIKQGAMGRAVNVIVLRGAVQHPLLLPRSLPACILHPPQVGTLTTE